MYTAFYDHTQTGEPLMRTMWNEFPNNPATYDISCQFMLGDSLLIAPKLKEPVISAYHGEYAKVRFYLPEEVVWYDW